MEDYFDNKISGTVKDLSSYDTLYESFLKKMKQE
jgi:hypothetical protein